MVRDCLILEERLLLLSLILRLVPKGQCADVSFDHVDLDVLHWRSGSKGHGGHMASGDFRLPSPRSRDCLGTLDVGLRRPAEFNGLGLESIEVCGIVQVDSPSDDRCWALKLPKSLGDLLVQTCSPSLSP